MKLDVKKIWKEVKANRKLLDECKPPHKFELIKSDRPSSKFICKKCGGKIGSQEYSWYIKGLEHGKI